MLLLAGAEKSPDDLRLVRGAVAASAGIAVVLLLVLMLPKNLRMLWNYMQVSCSRATSW